jgi:hypothetical protein
LTGLLSRSEIAVVVGVVLAVALILVARTLGRKRELGVYAAGLFVAAVAYLFFGLRGGAPPGRIGWEIVGAVAYGGLALLGALRGPLWLALGWTDHAGWDLFLHGGGEAGFGPAWYPPLCVGFDLFLGGYLAALALGGPAAAGLRVVARGPGPSRPTVH